MHKITDQVTESEEDKGKNGRIDKNILNKHRYRATEATFVFGKKAKATTPTLDGKHRSVQKMTNTLCNKSLYGNN